MATERGQIKWFDDSKGFGFIKRAQGDDVFVHFAKIVGKGFKTLAEGDEVEFTVTQGLKGPQAENVKKLTKTRQLFKARAWCMAHRPLTRT